MENQDASTIGRKLLVSIENFAEFKFDCHILKEQMSTGMPKDWKQIRLANGKTRLLPDWADQPLKFAFHPDEALKRGAFSHPPKVQSLKKSIRAKSRARR